MSSRGYVDAARTCASNGSGYRAIGATRESNWSAGIFAGWSCAGVALSVSLDCSGQMSPGAMTMAQTIAKTYRSVGPPGFCLGLIAMSPLLRPVQPTESVERADREGVLCSKRRFLCKNTGSAYFVSQ